MTLEELKEAIEELIDIEGDRVLKMEVYSEYDYGDIGHTRALTQPSAIEIVDTEETGYSNTGLGIYDPAPDDMDEEEEREKERKEVVALIA